MTTTDTPITVSRSRFTTTYEDNEYEITLATVTYSRHEHRWNTYCYTGPEEHECTTAERRSQAEETALSHAFEMHAAIDQPENLERLLALAPEDPRPPSPAAAANRRRGPVDPTGEMMAIDDDNILTVPAELVEALRAGLYVEQNAATDCLRLNPSPPRGRPAANRYKRLYEARDLLANIGHLPSDTPVTVQVNLDKHRLPLLAALYGKLEADARALASGDARDPEARKRIIATIDALGQLILNVEARGEVREDTAERKVERQLDSQLSLALEALGYDEERGDWWRVTYDAGQSLAIKSVIDGQDRYLHVTISGYSIS